MSPTSAVTAKPSSNHRAIEPDARRDRNATTTAIATAVPVTRTIRPCSRAFAGNTVYATSAKAPVPYTATTPRRVLDADRTVRFILG
jgi:hypothetical protein